MSRRAGYGRSSYTNGQKVPDFRSVIELHLSVSRAVMAGVHRDWIAGTYTYIDITAGPGALQGVEQSPLLFVRAAARAGFRWRACFLEKNARRCEELRANLLGTGPPHLGEFEVHHEDHREALGGRLRELSLTGRQLGLLYFDPTPGKDVLDTIRLLGDYTRSGLIPRRLDILLHLSATSFKRMPQSERIDTCIRAIGKKHWVVRETRHTDQQWTFLLGSNWDRIPAWEKKGFHRMEGERGQQIMDRLRYTRPELDSLRQPRLF